MTPIEFIGFAAATLGCVSLIPEIYQALRTHRLKDLAWGMLFLMSLSSIFWLVYGTYNQVMPLIVSSSLQLTMQFSLMGLKVLYNKHKKPLFIIPQKKITKNTEPSEELLDVPVEETTGETEAESPQEEIETEAKKGKKKADKK